MNIKREFKSFNEFYQYCASPCQDMPVSEREGGSLRRGNIDNWHGTETFEEAIELCENGWPEGLARIQEILAKLGSTLDGYIPVKDYVHSIEPTFEIDMGAHMRGEPEVFIEEVELEDLERANRPRIVHVVHNSGSLAGVTGDEMFARGAAIAAVVMVLEAHNIQCDIKAVNKVIGSSSGFSYQTSVHVKNPGEIIDFNRLAFILANPAYHRRLTFACREHEDFMFRKGVGVVKGGGYGSSTEVPLEEQGDIYSKSQGMSMADIDKWISDQLAKFNIEISK